MMLDTALENPSGQFWSRVDEAGSHFRCPDCSARGERGVGPNLMRWNNNRINREMEVEEERENRRIRIIEEDRRKPGIQLGTLSRDIPNKFHLFGTSNSYSPQKETFIERPETLPAYETSRDMNSYRTYVEGKSRGYETLHCESCHRTYRLPEQAMRQERSLRDSALFDLKNVSYNHSDLIKDTELRRESRNVTFDLSSRILEQRNIREEEARSSRDKDKGRERRHKAKIQAGRLLKVKLNLNPLRKSKVHPKRKHEDNLKKSHEKRQSGKERREKEEKVNSGKKTRGEKMKKSTKNTEDREGKGERESTAADQGKTTHPDKSQSDDTTNTAGQSASAIAIGQIHNLLGQATASVLTGPKPSSMHPFSLSTIDRNHTTNLSLLGSAGSQLTGSSLSLQGGNILLSTGTPGHNTLFPTGPANAVASSIGPNLAASGPLIENLSNTNSQTETEHVPGGSTVNMLAGGAALAEGPGVVVSGDSVQADVSVSVSGVSAPIMSTQSDSSTEGAAGAPALLHQEYLSEEEGSNPRRKLRLVLPEKTSSHPPTALERKIL